MKSTARRFLGWLGAIGGIVLIGLELFSRRGAETRGVSWFWLTIGIALVIFGVVELFSRGESPE